MLEQPNKRFTDLLVNRDFGSLLTVYFEFLKANFKSFVNVFLRYNGWVMIGLLVTSYLLVSGFAGLFGAVGNQTPGVETADTDTYTVYLFTGVGLYLLFMIMAGILNMGLATSYMVHYQEKEGRGANPRDIWKGFSGQLGQIILFILLAMAVYLLTFIVGVILAFIPIIGTLAYYGLFFFIYAWLGISFFSLIAEKKGLGHALSEGWELVKSGFWTCVGVNFILGLLNYLLILLLLTAPGVLVGIYTFHQFEVESRDTLEWLDTAIFSLGICILLVVMVFNQCLSQFVNGLLYYALHEKKYNVNTRRKIELIGKLDHP